MSERNLNRRALLRAGAAGFAALPAASALLPSMGFAGGTAPLSAEQADLIRQIREVKANADRLVDIELELEVPKGERGYRKYRRACYAAKRAEEELDCLTVEVLRRPVRDWGDVAVLGALTAAHAERSLSGGLALIENNEPLIVEPFSCDLRDYTMGALMQAALAMGGAHV